MKQNRKYTTWRILQGDPEKTFYMDNNQAMGINIQPETKAGAQIQNNTPAKHKRLSLRSSKNQTTFQTNTTETNIKNNKTEQKMRCMTHITGRTRNNILQRQQNYGDQYTTGNKNRNPKYKLIPPHQTQAPISPTQNTWNPERRKPAP